VENPDQLNYRKERIKFLEKKIVEEQVNARNVDPGERRANLAELEQLRLLAPSLSSRLSATIKRMQSSRLNYPKASLSRIAALGSHEKAFHSASDTRGLLASPSTVQPNLKYSESTGTFVTIQENGSVRGSATRLWSPFDRDPTVRAIHPSRPPPTSNDIELRTLKKTHRRTAIHNQYEPRHLHLTRMRKPRLTNAQLMEREPGWTNRPTARLTRSPGRPMLVAPETDMERAVREEQKLISKRYVYACAAFPPLILAFGLGAFDQSIRKKTSGNVMEASAKEKRNALLIFFPLGCIVWAVFIIVVFVVVTLNKDAS
jgi:hypothetical protein